MVFMVEKVNESKFFADFLFCKRLWGESALRGRFWFNSWIIWAPQILPKSIENVIDLQTDFEKRLGSILGGEKGLRLSLAQHRGV